MEGRLIIYKGVPFARYYVWYINVITDTLITNEEFGKLMQLCFSFNLKKTTNLNHPL